MTICLSSLHHALDNYFYPKWVISFQYVSHRAHMISTAPDIYANRSIYSMWTKYIGCNHPQPCMSQCQSSWRMTCKHMDTFWKVTKPNYFHPKYHKRSLSFVCVCVCVCVGGFTEWYIPVWDKHSPSTDENKKCLYNFRYSITYLWYFQI